MRINIVDATYGLENKMYNYHWEQERLQSQKLSSEDYLFKPNWDEDNGALKTELEFRRADLLYEKTTQDNRIATLEALLQGEDLRSRNEREFQQAKAAAAATPAEAWEIKAMNDSQWENDDWEDRWNVILEELERRIVYELEKNEDRSWEGKRLWRNNEGKVAMILDRPHKEI
ncbi:hypothetical protein F5B21DRAFT_521983 [Xylaria acuta]|nr:hypothetical protein F5B21DRAFT_521983 [Xylaria acuta]